MVVPSDYLEVVAREAFVEGMGVATLTAVGLMLAAMVAAITLPNKDPKPELPSEAEQQPLAREVGASKTKPT